MTLEEGDIILTGTPAGVGPVKPGDTITAGVRCEQQLPRRIVPPVCCARGCAADLWVRLGERVCVACVAPTWKAALPVCGVRHEVSHSAPLPSHTCAVPVLALCMSE
jgi:hypothetical protein